MKIEVECPDCDGCGLIQNNKGKEITCPTCKGKGTIYDEVKEGPESADTDAFDFQDE